MERTKHQADHNKLEPIQNLEQTRKYTICRKNELGARVIQLHLVKAPIFTLYTRKKRDSIPRKPS